MKRFRLILILVFILFPTERVMAQTPSPPTAVPAPDPISPDGIMVYEQRVWFTWTDTGDVGYRLMIRSETSQFSFWVSRGGCADGICSWRSPYLGNGEWTWSVSSRSGRSREVRFWVYGNVIDGGTVVERRIDYGDIVTAAGISILATMAVVWMMFDIVQRTLLRRMRQ